MSLVIRPARREDAGAIAAGEWQAASVPGRLNALPGEIPEQAYADKIEGLAQTPHGLYLVAEQDGVISGHLLLDPFPLASNSHICTLTVVVYPHWQARGIGRKLLNQAVEWARTAPKVEKIELMVRATNERAIRLYRSLGFEEEGRIRRRVRESNGVYHDDIAMGLFVKPSNVR